jgi:SNF2-related domain
VIKKSKTSERCRRGRSVCSLFGLPLRDETNGRCTSRLAVPFAISLSSSASAQNKWWLLPFRSLSLYSTSRSNLVRRRFHKSISKLKKSQQNHKSVLHTDGFSVSLDNPPVLMSCMNALPLLDLCPTVVLDEAHKTKNNGSNTSKNLRKVCGKNSHILMLTGTPLMNRLEVRSKVQNVVLFLL